MHSNHIVVKVIYSFWTSVCSQQPWHAETFHCSTGRKSYSTKPLQALLGSELLTDQTHDNTHTLSQPAYSKCMTKQQVRWLAAPWACFDPALCKHWVSASAYCTGQRLSPRIPTHTYSDTNWRVIKSSVRWVERRLISAGCQWPEAR